MKKIVLDHLNAKKDESHRSYMDIGNRCHMSDSKLSRIFTGQAEATVTDINSILALGLDSDPRELWAKCGMQEWDASAEIGYKGAAELIKEHSRQIAMMDERYASLLERGKAIREGMQESFTTAIDALKEAHIADLEQRDERYEDAVRKLRADFIKSESNFNAAMKSAKWWRGVAVGILGVVVFVTVYLIVDFSDIDTGLSNMILRMVKEGLL